MFNELATIAADASLGLQICGLASIWAQSDLSQVPRAGRRTGEVCALTKAEVECANKW